MIGFVWLCFFATKKHKIIHIYILYKHLHQFRPQNIGFVFSNCILSDTRFTLINTEYLLFVILRRMPYGTAKAGIHILSFLLHSGYCILNSVFMYSTNGIAKGRTYFQKISNTRRPLFVVSGAYCVCSRVIQTDRGDGALNDIPENLYPSSWRTGFRRP